MIDKEKEKRAALAQAVHFRGVFLPYLAYRRII
jgi:hypothetical protein